MTSTLGSYKVVGGEFIVPKEFEGKTLSANVYNVEGRLMQKTVTKNAVIKLGNNFGRTDEVFIVKLKAID
jgi:hypothetical protein